jgi:integrase/recombinase XerC
VCTSHETVEQRLAAIDRESLEGKRDYALLTLAFTSGRRRAELAALRWGDLSFGGSAAHPVVTFPAEGGKSMRDTLDPAVAEVLLVYLQTLYGHARLSLTQPGETPIWSSFAPKHYGQLVALGQQGIAELYFRRMSTTKVHTSRRTLAREMVRSGAPITELQARLGHSSLATTGIYASELGSSENPHASTLARRFGIFQHTAAGDSGAG